MKKIIERLQKNLEKLKLDEVDKRVEYFDNRTQRWQDSHNGDKYSNKTQDLDMICDELERVILELEDWINTKNT